MGVFDSPARSATGAVAARTGDWIDTVMGWETPTGMKPREWKDEITRPTTLARRRISQGRMRGSGGESSDEDAISSQS
jgi:hypothetical protein